jgi:LemA protein
MFAWLFLLVPLAWGIWCYNRLVRDSHRVRTAWSDVEVQLKRRHDLIPKLVEAVRQYAAYENQTLSHVTELRQRSAEISDLAEKSELEGQLASQLQKIFLLAEAYPELKADTSFLDLQNQITEVENHLQYARRYYNGAVRNLNIRIDSIPDTLVAQLFSFKAAQWFRFDGDR